MRATALMLSILLGVATANDAAARLAQARKHMTRAQVLLGQGKQESAAKQLESAAAAYGEVFGDKDNPELAVCLNMLGETWYAVPNYERAEPCFLRALAMREKLFGPESEPVAEALFGLSQTRTSMGKLVEGEQAAARCVAIMRKAFPKGSQHLAWALGQWAECKQRLGQRAEVVALLDEALEMEKRIVGADHPSMVHAFGKAARTLGSLDPTKALEYARAAHKHSMKCFGPDHRTTGTTHGILADRLFDVQRAAEALPHAEAFVRSSPSSLTARNLIVSVLITLGRGQDAVAQAEVALKLASAAGKGDELKAATCLFAASAYTEAGEGGRAWELAVEALACYRATYEPGHPSLLVAFRTSAVAANNIGRKDSALRLFEEGLDQARRSGAQQTQIGVTLRINYATTLAERQRWAEARSVLRVLVAELPLPGVWALLDMDAWSELADAELHLGGIERAAEAMERAEQVARDATLMRTIRWAHALSVRGRIRVNQERIEDAVADCRAALEIEREVRGGPHPHVANRLGALSGVLTRAGRIDEAIQCAREHVAMSREVDGERSLGVLRAMGGLWNALAQAGRSSELDELGRRRAELAREIRSPAPGDYLSYAQLLLGRGKPEEAADYLKDSIRCLDDIRSDAHRLDEFERAGYMERRQFGKIFGTMALAQLRMGHADQAWDYVERGRARAALDLLERSRFDPLDEAERRARDSGDEETSARVVAARQALTEARNQLGMSRREFGVALRQGEERRKASLEKLDVARAHLRSALSARADLVADIVPMAEPVRLSTVQRGLGRDELVLVYTTIYNGGLLLVVDRRKVHGYELPTANMRATRRDIEAHLRALASGGGTARGMKPARTTESKGSPRGAELFTKLMPAAAWKQVKQAKRIYIVPHGSLHRLPFETLLVDGATPWIDSGPEIAYVASGSVLAWCRRRRDAQRNTALAISILAIGDPKFEDLPALPGSRREAVAAAKAIGAGSVTLLGDKATEAALFMNAPRTRLLHLATHQIVDTSGAGSLSRLVFARSDAKRAHYDGSLHLHELFELWRDRLSGCQLVVLSACESQRGPVKTDEGVFAMPLGFLYAGVPAAIGSLWRVDDASTAELFADFYKRLAKGTPKLQAFTEARKALKKKYPDPYHWAAFVYMGDPR